MCGICIPGGVVVAFIALLFLAFGLTVPIWLTDVLVILGQAVAWTIVALLVVLVVRVGPDVIGVVGGIRHKRAVRRERIRQEAAAQIAREPAQATARARVFAERIVEPAAALPAASPRAIGAPPAVPIRIYATPREELHR